MSANDLFVVIWSFMAAFLLVRGTSRQKRVSDARFRRQAAATIDNYEAIKALADEVPRWRLIARRKKRSEIESALRDDPVALRDYRERRQEVAAWNDLETVAALLFGVAVVQALILLIGE